VTLELLHLEYLEHHPNGYRCTEFCEFYRRWLKHRGLSMRQLHRGGEKMFVDYAGKKPTMIDPATGEMVEVELFVAVLGASNYTYAEASRTQQIPDWIARHQRAFQYFPGPPPPWCVISSKARHDSLPLRARGPAHLRRARPPLQHRDSPGAPCQATGQASGFILQLLLCDAHWG
jgi:hypothetical protein